MLDEPLRVDHADLLRAFLSDTDTLCPACKYNLRGLTDSRCPECGEALVLQVGNPEPKLAAPIAGLIGIACGLGFNGLFAVGALVESTFRPGSPPASFFVVTLAGVAVETCLLVYWLKNWRTIGRQSRGAKIALVSAVWLLLVIDLVIFLVGVQ